MDPENPRKPDAAAIARRLARGLMDIVQTRIDLLLVEVQEERDRWIISFLLVLGCAAFGFLAFVALTIGLMALLWPHSPILSVMIPAGIHIVAAVSLYRRLATLRCDWQTLPSTFEQLRKDRECVQTWLG